MKKVAIYARVSTADRDCRVQLQGLVAPPAVVVGEVVFENPPQMPQGKNLQVQRDA